MNGNEYKEKENINKILALKSWNEEGGLPEEEGKEEGKEEEDGAIVEVEEVEGWGMDCQH